MTGKERLRAAFACRQVDRLPVCLWGVDPDTYPSHFRDATWAPLLQLSAEQADILSRFYLVYGSAPAGPVRRGTRVLERAGSHETVEHTAETPAGTLTQVVRNEYLTGAVLKPWVTDPAELPAARWLLGVRPPLDLESTRRRFAEMDARPNALPLLDFCEPIGHVAGLFGAQGYALMLADRPEEFQAMVESAAEWVEADLRALLEAGIRPTLMTNGSEWVTPPYAGAASWRTLCLPHLRRIVEMAHRHGCLVLAHCHGRIRGILDGLLEAGVDATHPFEAPPSGDITPAEFHRRAAGGLCGVGNLQLDLMLRGTPDDVRREVAHLLEVFHDWPAGGFVLTVSGTPTGRTALPTALANYPGLLEARAAGRRG